MVSSPIPRGRRGLALWHSSPDVAAAMMIVPGIEHLVAVLREKDPIVLRHSERAVCYAYLIGHTLGLRNAQLITMQKGGLLHDVGKLSVPLSILQKPGALTAEEWQIIRRHPADGHMRLMGRLEEAALDIVLFHHERYDGRGYPHGLKGTEIPILARVFSIADAFDAMTSPRRSYRDDMSPTVARDELERCAGTQFDPVVVQAFSDAFDDLQQAYAEYKEHEESLVVATELPATVALPVPVPRR